MFRAQVSYRKDVAGACRQAILHIEEEEEKVGQVPPFSKERMSSLLAGDGRGEIVGRRPLSICFSALFQPKEPWVHEGIDQQLDERQPTCEGHVRDPHGRFAAKMTMSLDAVTR